MAKPILHSYFRSSCTWRVRIALAFKKIDYQYEAVHLMKDGGEQFTQEFIDLNPMKEVPVLVVGDQALHQSVAILEYLEEKYPQPALLPSDLVARAKVRAVVETITSGIQPLQNLRVLLKLKDEADRGPWAKHWIASGFIALEEMLKRTSGKYCYGDVVTLADVCLVPQVYNAQRFGVDLAQFPTITRINSELLQLEAFKESSPANMPDCQ
ncbi:GSTZ1 [Cordylochernes scorpioides]|uniref:maleylacetoacetate isomerase n=1 Tax=Cordylochernes scorpioides TaxID=51811 RepID=A0ABY6K982_9ARAC|nr:GSTZ1 [Cordylochernes scorpioides]